MIVGGVGVETDRFVLRLKGHIQMLREKYMNTVPVTPET